MNDKEFKGVFFIYGTDKDSKLSRSDSDNRIEPDADLIAKKEAIEVYIDLPGVSIEDLRVYIKNSDLIVEGIKRLHKKTEDIRYILTEREFSSFVKVIRLPFDTKYEDCTARLRYGVLKIRLFKKLS